MTKTEYTVSWSVEEYADTPEDAVLQVAKAYFQDRIANGEPGTACVFTVNGIDYPVDRIIVDMSPYDLSVLFGHEHPTHYRENWVIEVQSGDTISGYWEWVKHQLTL